MEDSFLVGDLGETYRMYKLWTENLPMVKPFYAVKSNPDSSMLKLMAAIGIGFDCASKKEINTMLQHGVKPEDIIYANPCKQVSHLRFARQNSVKKMTFDNLEELHKTHKYYPDAELYLRILPMDCNSKVPFGEKFGAEVNGSCVDLLKTAKELNLNVTGISFHVGSDCLNPQSYVETIRRSKLVFDQAKKLDINIKVLDIGGGFPGHQNKKEFIEIAKAVTEALDLYYQKEDVSFIAEPGRFFAASYFTLATTVIGKRVCESNDDYKSKSIMYYLNDGVFKSFAEGAFIPQILYKPRILKRGDEIYPKIESTENDVECSLWGPALGAKDKINIEKGLKLPELKLEDWLYFENMGSYSTCFNMEFNGFEQSHKVYINTEKEGINKLLK
ncbi:hypothetical protein K502DRAFT_289664 [Neoconidiobolus thromboides FSU 785]|nr:hypothetical protein K502DRAFT_289664 [Neoconidiobolus thromboides FSU 785]